MKKLMLIMAAVGLLAGSGALHAKERSAKDQALYEKAMKECNGPQYPGGARAQINYGGGWFLCITPGSSRR